MTIIADVFEAFRADNIRQKHIYESCINSIGGMEKIRGRINEIAVEKMRHALFGSDDPSLDGELRALSEEKERLLAGAGAKRYNCEKCSDTG
jgi:hypothetical protein